jgi:hypothetical protein
LDDHWLIDKVAVPEVADRHNQSRAAASGVKFELACIGQSATMPPFGMCPEPAPIKPDNLIK